MSEIIEIDGVRYHSDYDNLPLLDGRGEKIPATECICFAWSANECGCGAWQLGDEE